MATSTPPAQASRLVLDPLPASELMTPDPLSVRAAATVPEATALLTDRGLHAAPVIDESGRPVGVVSRADVLIHERERRVSVPAGGAAEPSRVADIMTPAVFSVAPGTTADRVVEQMLALNVLQLFVVDDHGLLVGMVSARDVLKRLRP